VIVAQRTGSVLGERVAVALAVRGPQERGDDVEIPLGDVGRLPPAHRHTDSYPIGKLLLTNARRASIVSCMANHSPHLDNVFSALADPTRRAIIARLSQGEASVGELAQPFDMALPSLMKHIRVLEAGGLIESEKHGRVRTCRLMPGAMKGAENWLAEQRAMWEARLDRLESYLATLEKKPPRRRRRD